MERGDRLETEKEKQIARLRRLAAKAEATEQWGAEALFRLRADALERDA